MRGLNAPNGSWNTIWISRLNSRFHGSPLTIRLPSESIRCITAFASVVLPQPLSPMMPNVSPDLRSKEMGLRMVLSRFLNQPSDSLMEKAICSALRTVAGFAGKGATLRIVPALSSILVYSCCGLAKTSAALPVSRIRPLRITATSSAKRRTRFKSCVM